MNTRQKARDDLEKRIIELINQGVSESDIVIQLGCKSASVESARHRNGMYKQSQNANQYSRIDDYKDDPKPSQAVKYFYKGKRYLDVTGDIVDCGIAYKRKD